MYYLMDKLILHSTKRPIDLISTIRWLFFSYPTEIVSKVQAIKRGFMFKFSFGLFGSNVGGEKELVEIIS